MPSLNLGCQVAREEPKLRPGTAFQPNCACVAALAGDAHAIAAAPASMSLASGTSRSVEWRSCYGSALTTRR